MIIARNNFIKIIKFQIEMGASTHKYCGYVQLFPPIYTLLQKWVSRVSTHK